MWRKTGDNFYKIDEESIVTIREELLENFFSLAESHLEAIRRMIERLEDGQFGTQLQFERYEREAAINISDEEQTMEPQPQLEELPNEAEGEQPREAGADQDKVVGSEKEAGIGKGGC